MNPHTGELAWMASDEKRAGFERLPERLQDAARLKLAEAKRYGAAPKVNTKSQHPLANWARAEKKAKRKAKTAAASRRRNRK